MDKGEKRDLAMMNGIFADDSNPDDSSDSDYEPVEKVRTKIKTKVKYHYSYSIYSIFWILFKYDAYMI